MNEMRELPNVIVLPDWFLAALVVFGGIALLCQVLVAYMSWKAVELSKDEAELSAVTAEIMAQVVDTLVGDENESKEGSE